MKTFQKILTLFAICVLSASATRAATITSSDTFLFSNPAAGVNSITNSALLLSNVTVPFNASSSAITLSKFDTSLGTLNSISFSVEFTTSETSGTVSFGSLGLLSDASLARTVTLDIGIAGFTNPSSATATINQAALITIFNGGGAFSDVAGPGSFGSLLFSSGAQIAALSGGGTFDVSLTSNDVYTINKLLGVGSYSLTGASDYAGSVTVIYEYTAVPEPSSWGLIGAFFLVLVFMRRRHCRV